MIAKGASLSGLQNMRCSRGHPPNTSKPKIQFVASRGNFNGRNANAQCRVGRFIEREK
jgi:hypothetical protein